MQKSKFLAGAAALGAMSAAERAKGRYMRDATGHKVQFKGTTPAEIATEVKDAIEAVWSVAEEAKTNIKNLGDLTAETKAKADEALTKFNVLDQLKARMDAVEQKNDRDGGKGDETKSYGQQVIANEGIKQLFNKERTSVRIELKAITSASGSAGGLIVSQRETDVVSLPQRTDITLRDLLTVMPIETSSVDYPKQSVRTNAAAPVAEGTQKPYSNYGWTRAQAPVRTIAHLAKLTRQALDDAPRLQAEVDAEMRYGLALQEDSQILLGDGTGENLYGLMPQATGYVDPTAGVIANPTRIDKLRLAYLQASMALFPADGVVLNPIDWAIIELTKDAAGGYIFANPVGVAGPTLWGKPVAATQSMTLGSFLAGAFKAAATLYDRMTPEVLISSENANDFELNLLTMRCEERVALAVKRAAALVKGTF